MPPLRQLPSRPQAPTYAAQLPIEVVPAGSLAGRVQPAQRFQHELLLRREGAALPPCASRRHGPGRPGLPTPTASRRVVPLVCSPRSGLGSALHSRPRRRQQRAHSPDLKNRPRRAPRPGQEATPALGERTLAGTGMRGGCLRGPRGLGTRALPRLPRREPRGTPRKLPGRRLLAGCQGEAGGGAGSDQLRTARTAQRRRGDREQPGQWPKSSTFEGGDGGDWGTVPRILLAAAASPAASQPQTPRGSPTLIQASGPVGLAPRLRPDSLSRGPPGQPHQG